MDGDGEVKFYSNYLIHLHIAQGLLLCKTLDVMHCEKKSMQKCDGDNLWCKRLSNHLVKPQDTTTFVATRCCR
jgi:hypothetical protein